MEHSQQLVTLTRFKPTSGKQTLGIIQYKEFSGTTLELPWKDNAYRISCIPEGMYRCNKRHSAKYGHHFMINHVEGRDMILIHSGNYYTHTLGCILVGKYHKDIDGDGLKDVTNSKDTLKELNTLLPNYFMLNIIQEA